jgi:diguanylate cyclase (GGDEF)-like protein
MGKEAGPGDGAPSRRVRIWVAAACTVLTIGTAVSLAISVLWYHDRKDAGRQSFVATTGDVSTALGTELRRETDFVSTLRAVFTMEPSVGSSRFADWFDALHGRARLSGTLGTVVIRSIPRGRLRGFQLARNADPNFRALMGGETRVIGPGPGRARSCILAAAASPLPAADLASAVQGDWCNPRSPVIGSGAYELRQAADTGQYPAAPATAYGIRVAFLDAAFYRPGARLNTVAARRRAVGGWISTSFNADSLLASAIAKHRGLEVSLYHSNPGERPELIGTFGNQLAQTAFTHTDHLTADGGWTVAYRGSPDADAVPPLLQGLLIFAGGTGMSLLLAILIVVLATGRTRALRIADEKADELTYTALHDPLTDLPNRALALDRAKQMLKRAPGTPYPVAALYLDIDNLGQINDVFGHAVGDECLTAVADRIRGALRGSDTAARVDGDEFLVLVNRAGLVGGPELVAERLLEVVREPYQTGGDLGRCLPLTVSIGMAQGIELSAETLVGNAKLAADAAKSAGKDGWVEFEAGMHAAANDRVGLELDLADALETDQLFLVYQPLVDLRNERPKGVEALLRWRHPERGVVSPAESIPIAEENGMIMPIGKWVLRAACAQAAAWSAAGHALGVSVNVSVRQLERDELIDDVLEALADSGVEPAALTLEITESALMHDPDSVVRRLRALKKLGVRLSIDDFGTGYSSLAYLRRFPVDQLKIDRSFISGGGNSRRSATLVHMLVRLGETLGLETLAEGIETRRQLADLRTLGCDSGQGFLFSRPLEADAVIEFVTGGHTHRLLHHHHR